MTDNSRARQSSLRWEQPRSIHVFTHAYTQTCVPTLLEGFFPIFARNKNRNSINLQKKIKQNKKTTNTSREKKKKHKPTAQGAKQPLAKAGSSDDKTQLWSLDLVQAQNFCQDSVWSERRLRAAAERSGRGR